MLYLPTFIKHFFSLVYYDYLSSGMSKRKILEFFIVITAIDRYNNNRSPWRSDFIVLFCFVVPADHVDRRFRHRDRRRHQDVHRGYGVGQPTVYHQVGAEIRTENGTPQHVHMVSGAQLGRRQKVADENPIAREIRPEGEYNSIRVLCV